MVNSGEKWLILVKSCEKLEKVENTVTVLIIRGDLCSRISRFKKKREIK